MINREKIIELAKINKKLKTSDVSTVFNVSRQYANSLINSLVLEHKLLKFGSTKNSFYVLPDIASKESELIPDHFEKKLSNHKLEEHKVLDELERKFPPLAELPENVRSIFVYAFSEMLNNAIEHSESETINISVSVRDKKLFFTVNDFGIGVFRNIKQKKGLNSELEAVQELLKGKMTTMPKSHSGEGIYFTSRASDFFALESFEYDLIVDNKIDDVFFGQSKRSKKGTKVVFSIAIDSGRHLIDIFNKYTIENDDGVPGFDKTEIRIKMYTVGGVHVSRSQARRLLFGLNKFKSIIFDFSGVPMIGQAFADEVFRVFREKFPDIKLQAINTNDAVKFMIDRADGGISTK